MAKTIKEKIEIILSTLVTQVTNSGRSIKISGHKLRKLTELNSSEINETVRILKEYGYVELFCALGTSPFDFQDIILLPKGKYEYELIVEKKTDS